ncbi:hypothetical protein HZC34_04895 [Candidatus Saganbacteria bacterium]|nr:hypothetical protein [Candidatus Saganbacteria bacterium]
MSFFYRLLGVGTFDSSRLVRFCARTSSAIASFHRTENIISRLSVSFDPITLPNGRKFMPITRDNITKLKSLIAREIMANGAIDLTYGKLQVTNFENVIYPEGKTIRPSLLGILGYTDKITKSFAVGIVGCTVNEVRVNFNEPFIVRVKTTD